MAVLSGQQTRICEIHAVNSTTPKRCTTNKHRVIFTNPPSKKKRKRERLEKKKKVIDFWTSNTTRKFNAFSPKRKTFNWQNFLLKVKTDQRFNRNDMKTQAARTLTNYRTICKNTRRLRRKKKKGSYGNLLRSRCEENSGLLSTMRNTHTHTQKCHFFFKAFSSHRLMFNGHQIGASGKLLQEAISLKIRR